MTNVGVFNNSIHDIPLNVKIYGQLNQRTTRILSITINQYLNRVIITMGWDENHRILPTKYLYDLNNLIRNLDIQTEIIIILNGITYFIENIDTTQINSNGRVYFVLNN